MHGCNDIIELIVVTYTHCHLVGSFSEHLLIYEVVVQSEESQTQSCLIGETTLGQWTEKTLAMFAAHYVTHHTSLAQRAGGPSSHS